MLTLITVALALTLALTSIATASTFVTGNVLFQRCASPDGDELFKCAGYIEGAADAAGSRDGVNGYKARLPVSVTLGQVKDVVSNFLIANAAIRHYPAAGLVANALENAFPCR
jgi:hypothetical protein